MLKVVEGVEIIHSANTVFLHIKAEILERFTTTTICQQCKD